MHHLSMISGRKIASRISIIFLVLSLTPGCATIIRGTTQSIPISSEPSGADIIVDGALVGLTPDDIALERGRDHLITLEKEDYQTRSIPIVKSIGGAVWGNVLAGGFIGWGVDAASGAQYDLNPETVFVRLIPLEEGESPEEAQNEGTTIITRLNEIDQMRESNQISDEEYSRMRLSVLEQYYPEAPQEADTEP